MNETPGKVERVPVPESSPQPKRGGSGLKWIIIGVGLAAVAGLAAWKFVPAFSGGNGIVETAEPVKSSDAPPEFGEVFQLEDIVINPAGSRRVFMVSVTLEIANKEKAADVKKREALLRDNLITLFASQPLDVLIDIKYRQAFRARVKKVMDYQLGEGVISRVFFEKWVFQ